MPKLLGALPVKGYWDCIFSMIVGSGSQNKLGRVPEGPSAVLARKWLNPLNRLMMVRVADSLCYDLYGFSHVDRRVIFA